MNARAKVTWYVALAVCMSVWCGPIGAQSLRKISIAEPGQLFLYIPLYYAIDRGYFAKEGLAVEMLTAGRRDLAMTAVIAGEAFASVHDPVEVALARSRGAKEPARLFFRRMVNRSDSSTEDVFNSSQSLAARQQ